MNKPSNAHTFNEANITAPLSFLRRVSDLLQANGIIVMPIHSHGGRFDLLKICVPEGEQTEIVELYHVPATGFMEFYHPSRQSSEITSHTEGGKAMYGYANDVAWVVNSTLKLDDEASAAMDSIFYSVVQRQQHTDDLPSAIYRHHLAMRHDGRHFHST